MHLRVSKIYLKMIFWKNIYIFVKKIICKHVLDLNSSVSHTCIKKTPSLQEGANKGKRRTVGGFLVKKSNCLVCSSGHRFLDVSVIASLCVKEDHKGNTLTERKWSCLHFIFQKYIFINNKFAQSCLLGTCSKKYVWSAKTYKYM